MAGLSVFSYAYLQGFMLCACTHRHYVERAAFPPRFPPTALGVAPRPPHHTLERTKIDPRAALERGRSDNRGRLVRALYLHRKMGGRCLGMNGRLWGGVFAPISAYSHACNLVASL